MKRIRDFVLGKIRRAEVGDALTFEPGGPDHPGLGACEGRLTGPGGAVTLHAEGLILPDGTDLLYTRIERVELAPLHEGRREVHILPADGPAARLLCSDAGGLVLHATLRGVGHTRLRRRIAD